MTEAGRRGTLSAALLHACNTTGALGATYGYDDLNRLTSASAGAGATTFAFDPMNRLATSTVGGVSIRRQYVGDQLVAEYNPATGAMTKRYIPGLGLDDVAVAYDGSGTSTRTWQLADERGSVIALSGSTGAVSNINTYDEYGVPGSSNTGRFQYTGQQWLPEAGLYHYRARAYLPQVGRFLQTDPIGYVAGVNLYTYVTGDPINMTDPSGLQQICSNSYSRSWTEANGDWRVEYHKAVCVDVPDIREFFDWTIGTVEQYFAQQCAMGGTSPSSSLALRDTTGSMRSGMESMLTLSGRTTELPDATRAWGTAIGQTNYAMNAVVAAGDAYYQTEMGASPILAGANSFGSATAAIGSGLLVTASLETIPGLQPIAPLIGAGVSAWVVDTGLAAKAGNFTEQVVGQAMGC